MTKKALTLIETYKYRIEVRVSAQEHGCDNPKIHKTELNAELALIDYITSLENKIKNLSRKKKLDMKMKNH